MKVTLVRSRAIDPAINKVARALAENGYDVKLLVWDRMGNKQTENTDGYTIYRFGFKAPHDKLTVIFYFPIWWLYEFLFLMRDNAKIIHICDLDTLIPAIFVKLIKKIKLCYTIYDFYANNLPSGHLKLIRKLIRTSVAYLEKFGIRFTDVLILVDESRYEEVKGAQINELIYIYNSPPYYFNLRNEPQNKAEIVIFYAGLIIRPRGIEYMIKAINDIDNVRLIIAGACHDKEILAKVSQCQKIDYLGWIPSYEEILEKTSEADILFRFSDPKVPKTKYESPNKLFEAMMFGKPIIVSDGSSMANIVRNENCGFVVPYGDVKAIREAIVDLKNNPKLCEELGRNGMKAYKKTYSWEIMETRLINVYSKILAKN